jgi:[acyl-carrier-protein] S-malonyltransferase
MKKIFLFPGQGSQFVGMGKSLLENFSVAKQTFEEANDAVRFDLKKLCLDGPESDLKLTHITQPAILTHSVAAFRVISTETGLKPDFVAGHSLGEYSALVAAGALQFADAARIVNKRGQFMQEAVPVGTGSMAAMLGCTETAGKTLCETAAKNTGKVCEMANFNGGGQIVLSGHKEAIEEAVRLAESDKSLGIMKAVLLTVSAPFHCSLMKKAEEYLRPHLEKIQIGNLAQGYLANVDAELHSDAAGIVPRLLQQICGGVRWEQSMQKLASLEVTEAFEIGPGRVLSGLLRRIDRNVKAKGVDTAEDVKAL